MSEIGVFYVAGMHRSGTSATTRVLNMLGLSVGADESLIPPAPNNPRGYWEQTRVCALNDEVLVNLGGSWDFPPPLPKGWETSQRAVEWTGDARGLLQHLMTCGAENYVVKDPRFSLTLPMWERAVPAAGVVLPVRDPRAVCQSLQRRNRMSPVRAATLWLRYNEGVLTGASSPLIVAYEDLLADPGSTAERMGSTLGLEQRASAASNAIRDFVDSSLNHADVTEELAPSRELNLAFEVYQLIRDEDLRSARNALSERP